MSENKNILPEDSVDEKSKNSADVANENFEFVTEVIKKKPYNKKKLVTKFLTSILMGIIIGLVACVVFVLFEPKLYKKMYPEIVREVLINDELPDENTDVTEDNENTTESVETDDDEANKQEEQNGTATDNAGNDNVETETVGGDVSLDEKDRVSGQAAKIEEEQKGIVEGFSDFYKELNNIADASKEYMVEVTGVSDGTDWFNNAYKNENSSFGIIVADNGKELLIITNINTIKNSSDIEVRFSNEKKFTGYVKNSDDQTGIAVVAVNLDDIDKNTKEIIVMAPLGNSNTKMVVGSPVIAVGAPLGLKETIAFGRITSNYSMVELVDNEVRCLTTDIYGADSGTGIIIDFDGKVLGIITKAGATSDNKNFIRAYSISDLKPLIEKLSNGRSVALLGIKGISVTKEANEEYMVPFGAFVKEVVPDSPAMSAGIQNGDVIVKLGTNEIGSFEDYKTAMLKCQPGDTLMVTLKRSTREGYREISYEVDLKNINDINK